MRVSDKASRAVLSLGLQQKDLIVQCNRRRVATNLQALPQLFNKVNLFSGVGTVCCVIALTCTLFHFWFD
jgi:hypothetical protein